VGATLWPLGVQRCKAPWAGDVEIEAGITISWLAARAVRDGSVASIECDSLIAIGLRVVVVSGPVEPPSSTVRRAID
jgi:hypothetical protein